MFERFGQQEALELIRRSFPAAWVEGLLTHGSGGGILYAIGKVAERCCLAFERAFTGLTPGLAAYGAVATGQVRVYRETVIESRTTTTLPAGTLLWDVSGETVRTLAPVSWEANDSTPRDVSVESVRRSWQANLRAGTRLVLRHVPRSRVPTPDVVRGEVLAPGLQGGAAPCLEGLVDSRGISRMPGESAAMLRDRLRHLEDIVTPASIRRVIGAYMPDSRLFEAWDIAGFADTGLWADGAWSLGDACGRWSRATDGCGTGWFVVWVPAPVVAIQDLTWLFADYSHTDYQDGACAAYLPGRMPDGTWYDVGGYGMRGEVAALCQAVEMKRPAGVLWQVEEG